MNQMDFKYLSIFFVSIILLTRPVLSQPHRNDLQELDKKKYEIENLSHQLRELKSSALELRNYIILKNKKGIDKISQSIEVNMKEIIFWSEKRNEELRYEQSRKKEVSVNPPPPVRPSKDTLIQKKERDIDSEARGLEERRMEDGRMEDGRMEDGRMDPKRSLELELKNQQILLDNKNKRVAREKELYASFKKQKTVLSDTSAVIDNKIFTLLNEFNLLIEEEIREMQIQLQKDEEEQRKLRRQEFENRKNLKEQRIPQEQHNEQ